MSRFRRRNDKPRFRRNGKPSGSGVPETSKDLPKIAYGGRPTDYRQDVHPPFAEYITRLFGATNVQIAGAMNIPKGTFDQWMIDRKEFASAIRRGRDYHDTNRVERTLLERAMGYKYTEKRIKRVLVEGIDAEGAAVALPAEEITETHKHIVPNMTAIIFWLKNRQPERWRDVQAVDIKSEHKEEKVVRFEMLAGLKMEFDKLEITELEKLLTHYRGESNAADAIPAGSSSDVRTVDVG